MSSHAADEHDSSTEHSHHDHHPAHAGDTSGDVTSRISRAQLLQAIGGGVAFTMAAGVFGAEGVLAAAPKASLDANPVPKQAEYVCLIVLDGGRPEYITNNLASLPTVRSLLRRGRWYNQAWVGDLMSITPPGHAVIGSGSFPRNDGGIVNWDWGIHSTGKISPTTQALENYQNGWVFKLMQESGTPTLSGVIRKAYPNDPVIAGSGAHFHAAGPLGGPEASWIYAYQRANGYWAPYSLGQHKVPPALIDDASLRVKLPGANNSTVPVVEDPLPLGQQNSLVVDFAIKALHRDRPRAIMLNLPEVDTVGHWSTKWHLEELQVYQAFDRSLAKLIDAYKTAGIYDKTLFVITADHGMIQSKDRVLDHVAVEDQIKTQLGHSSIILTNGGGSAGPTMTSIWLKDPANNGPMAKAIFDHHYDNVSAIYYMDRSGSQPVYRRAGIEDSNQSLAATYDYLFSTMAGTTGPDIGILLRENARNSGLPQMLGRHGGGDWGSQNVTLIFSGPGVKIGKSNAPARLVDVAPTIERFMGLSPEARDGIVLADAFQNPHPADVTAQKKISPALSIHVNALQARANHDISLETNGELPNFIPADEAPVVHWKRRLAVTIAGVAVLGGTGVGVGVATKAVRKQGGGTKLQWEE
jgi:predicted AlkP superfamily pyrophosphatase or phosphodiesterase